MNEIDLHGLESLAALDAFVGFFNERVRNGDYSPITAIHGYGASGGSGVIRGKLRNFLAAHHEYLEFQKGEDLAFHNLGETIVFPKKALPSATDLLSTEILEYCTQPKTRTKIAGKFRNHGEAKIRAALATLEKTRRLSVSYKGAHKHYQKV
jgi:hypothetical protein